METKKQTEDFLHPSMLQIRYLMELEKTGKRWGSVALIADICGVSHSPVSRFFKECIGCGYLTEKYEFTEKGTRALELYKSLIQEVQTYLERMGVAESDIPDKMQQLIENVDYDLLTLMTRGAGQMQKKVTNEKEEEQAPYFLENVLEKGKYDVQIAVHQVNREMGTKLSMAHMGFRHIACIRHNNRGSWLELTIQEMHAQSRLDGGVMTGHLSSLKYEKQGQLFAATIKGDKLKIPLDACRFLRSNRGNMKGMIVIMVTCSVGKVHMPESTAVLTFWL